MSTPTIAVINFSARSDLEVQAAVRAVNRQIQEDFLPLWGQGRELRLHAASFEPSGDPEKMGEEKVAADSVLYLVNESTLAGALGYHSINTAEIPVGFVFAQESDWTITLSHEALELVVDPNVNAFIPGPHPTDRTKWVLHAYEVCDAVERMSYEIDGLRVSDFLTPQYFQLGDARGTRNDYLGVGVKSFGITRGSHIAFIDPATWKFVTVIGKELPAASGVLQRRVQMSDHEKPRRPSDDVLAKMLATAKDRMGSRRAAGLDTLRGVTRTSRYRAMAELMRPTLEARAEAAVAASARRAEAGQDEEIEQFALDVSSDVTKQIREFERRRAERLGSLPH